MVFNKYSSYYDLLYKDKNYLGEVAYIYNLIQKYNPDAKSILDLGCGTGRHDYLLAETGYSVTGVDQSCEMLEIAREKIKIQFEISTPLYQSKSSISFIQGDIRTIRLIERFDTIISLFHVMSYQTSNEDLNAAFKTAKIHLKKGGLFIFDCWYGPAVLTDKPVVRVKHLENEKISVTRIAEPIMKPNENIVDVNYHVFIRNKFSNEVEEIKETHRMRYLFKSEIEELLRVGGLELLSCEEWMTGKGLGFDTWNGCFVCK